MATFSQVLSDTLKPIDQVVLQICRVHASKRDIQFIYRQKCAMCVHVIVYLGAYALHFPSPELQCLLASPL